MTILFYKYQGTGNDFIILDNRTGGISLTNSQVRQMCDRRFGIGADGLMLLNLLEGYDFEMKYFNADGNESSMCGNGGRCLVRFAFDMGIRKTRYLFKAVDGDHEAVFGDNDWINLRMKDVSGIRKYYFDYVLNTGSPHYVKPTTDVRKCNVVKIGRDIRYSDEFKKEGINVNFVEGNDKQIFVRTYERGVEDETLSCGTGVTAAAIVYAHNDNGFNRIEVKTPGGELAVEYDKVGEEEFRNIWLCGPAEYVFRGQIEL